MKTQTEIDAMTDEELVANKIGCVDTYLSPNGLTRLVFCRYYDMGVCAKIPKPTKISIPGWPAWCPIRENVKS